MSCLCSGYILCGFIRCLYSVCISLQSVYTGIRFGYFCITLYEFDTFLCFGKCFVFCIIPYNGVYAVLVCICFKNNV